MIQKSFDDKKDNEIIQQVLAGDANAFEGLLYRYNSYVCKIVIKHLPHNDVEEAVQEVFIRAYKSLPTFKRKSAFRHWLASISVRTCYDFLRKKYKNREEPMSSLSEKQQQWLENAVKDQSKDTFCEAGLQQEAREVLDWALGRLSAEDRIVIDLVLLEGRSTKEAAELLGWTRANVKVRSFRSRNKLKKLLEPLLY